MFALFWPDVLEEANLAPGWTPLQQELEQFTPDGHVGLLRVDKLFEFIAHTSGDPRDAHFEMQMYKDLGLPCRMYEYHTRGRIEFGQPMGRFAILGDDDPDWKPTSHFEESLGCVDTFTFLIAKLIEWRDRMAELEAGDNLFGLFLCAHLETMATRGNVTARQEAKYRLLANLMRRNILPADFRHWYRLIDWIMKLTPEQNRTVWERLEALKEANTVSHVTFAEIIGHEKGLKQGLKEGMIEGLREGLKEGRADGLKEGLKEGLRGSLNEALLAKFPNEGPTLVAEFKNEINEDRIKHLLRAAVLAASLDDFRTRIAAH